MNLDDVLKNERRRHLATPLPGGLKARLMIAARRRKPVWPYWILAASLALAMVVWRMDRDPAFRPVPGSEGLPEPRQKLVLRVRLPKDLAREYGFDAQAEVDAEFLVGEDGLARAVRVFL